MPGPPTTAVTIDAHHHLWKYNERDYVWMSGAMGTLRRDFLPEHLREVMREAGIDGAVAVQARQMVEETEWLLDLAGFHHWMRGVVGWVPLADAGAGRALERFADHPKLKGVRHVLHDEPDPRYMLRDDFNRGIALERIAPLQQIALQQQAAGLFGETRKEKILRQRQ